MDAPDYLPAAVIRERVLTPSSLPSRRRRTLVAVAGARAYVNEGLNPTTVQLVGISDPKRMPAAGRAVS